jgi:methyltransferase
VPGVPPAFWLLWGALLVQRAVEVGVARRNTRRLVAQGGRVVPRDGYAALVATHATFFMATAAEAFAAPWAGVGWWTAVGLALFVAGEALRGWSMLALGARWTTRVVVLPAAPLVATGPYRFLRHPIYVGVSLFLAGFCAAFALWGSLAAVAALQAVALRIRIRREESALAQASAVAP